MPLLGTPSPGYGLTTPASSGQSSTVHDKHQHLLNPCVAHCNAHSYPVRTQLQSVFQLGTLRQLGQEIHAAGVPDFPPRSLSWITHSIRVQRPILGSLADTSRPSFQKPEVG